MGLRASVSLKTYDDDGVLTTNSSNGGEDTQHGVNVDLLGEGRSGLLTINLTVQGTDSKEGLNCLRGKKSHM